MPKRPTWFTIVAVLLVVWGAAGVFACIQQFRLGAAAMGPPTVYDRALHASLPAWYDYVFLVATVSGLAGAIALFARRRIAGPLFIVSLVAVFAQFGWLFATTDIVAAKGAANVLPFPIIIAAVAIAQILLAGLAVRRGWTR